MRRALIASPLSKNLTKITSTNTTLRININFSLVGRGFVFGLLIKPLIARHINHSNACPMSTFVRKFKITSAVFPLQSDWSVTGRCQGKARATEMNEVYVINFWTENAILSQKVFFTFCVEHIAQIIERPSLPHSIFVLPEKIDFQTFNKITTAKLERIHPNKICKTRHLYKMGKLMDLGMNQS